MITLKGVLLRGGRAVRRLRLGLSAGESRLKAVAIHPSARRARVPG